MPCLLRPAVIHELFCVVCIFESPNDDKIGAVHNLTKSDLKPKKSYCNLTTFLSLGRQRGFIDVSGRPHAAKIVSNPLSYFKDQYNLTWTVDSFLPIKEYRILYRVFTVSSAFMMD